MLSESASDSAADQAMLIDTAERVPDVEVDDRGGVWFRRVGSDWR